MSIVCQNVTRYVLAVQYRGTKYHGFSHLRMQPTFRTVEGDLMKALSKLVGENNFKNIQVSSRTDRGVHAISNTLHVDISHNAPISTRDPKKLQRGINFYLSREPNRGTLDGSSRNNDIRIINAAEAPTEHAYSSRNGEKFAWHARHTAIKRTYEYRVLVSDINNGDLWVPFEAEDRSWLFRQKEGILDVDSMKEAASYLIGTHDFTSFQSVGCSRSSPITTLHDIKIYQTPYIDAQGWRGSANLGSSNIVSINISGSSFLYHQVRNIIGCLVWEIGRGKAPPSSMNDILERKSRINAPRLAPAHGLYLVSVDHEGFSFDS